MSVLLGKGIWTLYSDIKLAVSKAEDVGAKYILCKVSNRGKYNPQSAKAALTAVRSKPGLVPVAWSYNYLEDINAEVECIRCALADGFEAFIIDAEAHTNLKFGQAEEFSRRVIEAGIDTNRLYLCSDPRLDNKLDEIPYIGFAKCCRGGFIPMIYGEIMPTDRANAAARVTKSAYEQYERHRLSMGYTIPIMPAISSYWDPHGKVRMNYAEFKKWCDEVEQRSASFVTLYRAEVTSPEAWRAFKELKVSGSEVKIIISDDDTPTETHVFVQPGGPGYQEIFYAPPQPGNPWKEFVDKSGNLTRYRKTSSSQTMYATYVPQIPAAGRYSVEVFIPGTNATTRGAQYFVAHVDNGELKETRVSLRQVDYSDKWAPLGLFQLDPAVTGAGRVNLVDITADTQARDIAFSAIRWRPVPVGGKGFDSPIGTEEERAAGQVWPGSWFDANPYLAKYGLGYHTGADLNLNSPRYDSDRGKPVHAASDGIVIYAQVARGTWGGLVVIRHEPLPDGRPVYSRYGHVENIMVRPGDVVSRGQQVAQVGLFGKLGEGGNYHLHFDISLTDKLEQNPLDWPGENLADVRKNYVDPRKFIQDNRP